MLEDVILTRIKLFRSLQILRKYEWLLDAFVLDFFVDEHWSKLPKSWDNFFDRLEPEELCGILDNNAIRSRRTWPLSLLALKCLLKELCVCRKEQQINTTDTSTLLQHPKLKYIFTKGIKPKKLHEIRKMVEICKYSCLRTPVDIVIDFGAGLGHLARILGYAYGVKVCCLEMQDALNVHARVIDEQFEVKAKTYLCKDDMSHFQRPTHISLKLTADMSASEFLNTIKEAVQMPNNNFRFGIIGLHPCGDLSVILMRMFLKCKQAQFLNFVGCCYMKLTTKATHEKDMQSYGYPLSTCMLKDESFSHLSYEAREVSTHAIEMYYDRLLACDYEYLKIHSFRAAAERIIIKFWPEMKHSALRSVKHIHGMTFENYFKKAVNGLLPCPFDINDFRDSTHNSDIKYWKRIVIFYTLRLMLAPLVESVILYDRILLLAENDCEVEMKPIFDPRLSPRNHLILAVKRRSR